MSPWILLLLGSHVSRQQVLGIICLVKASKNLGPGESWAAPRETGPSGQSQFLFLASISVHPTDEPLRSGYMAGMWPITQNCPIFFCVGGQLVVYSKPAHLE